MRKVGVALGGGRAFSLPIGLISIITFIVISLLVSQNRKSFL